MTFTLAVSGNSLRTCFYYKQPKKDDDGYHLGTVNVRHPQSRKRLSEIEWYYADARK